MSSRLGSPTSCCALVHFVIVVGGHHVCTARQTSDASSVDCSPMAYKCFRKPRRQEPNETPTTCTATFNRAGCIGQKDSEHVKWTARSSASIDISLLCVTPYPDTRSVDGCMSRAVADIEARRLLLITGWNMF
ncbi:hypothetical protein F5Y18DRAFT_400757 [Xylariaceae sp. FL1019]|nr:hypothetical protein F5Y18DRAFT_400757 [Xylariaceae sp. FL1019]